jgi:hypothetical protein
MRRTYHRSLVRRLALALSLVVLLTLVGAAALSSGPTARAQTLPPVTPVVPPRPPVPPVPPVPPRPPLPSDRIRVPVTEPGELFSEGRRCAIIVTPDDFTQEGSLRLIEVPLGLLIYRDPALTYLRACEVEYRDAADNLITAFQFTQPIEVCFPYDNADLARAQGSAERLTVIAFDPFRQVWVELPLTLDQAARRICGQLPGAGVVALAIRPARVVTLPGTSGNLPEGTPTAAAVAAAAPAAAQPAPVAQPTAAAAAAAAAAPAPDTAAAAPGAAAPVAAAPAGGLLPGAPAADAVSTTSPLSYLPLGLFIAAAVAAAITVLSRNFIRRGREDEGE